MMKLIRKENEIILNSDTDIVEIYNFSKEINFKGLYEYLVGLNLSQEISMTDNLGDKMEVEDNLVNLIADIISDYNTKVKELKEFKKSEKN